MLGTIFEWYDFSSTACWPCPEFGAVPPDNPIAAVRADFGSLAAGFVVRPVGALLLGHIGDRVCSKYKFLVTIVMWAIAPR